MRRHHDLRAAVERHRAKLPPHNAAEEGNAIMGSTTTERAKPCPDCGGIGDEHEDCHICGSPLDEFSFITECRRCGMPQPPSLDNVRAVAAALDMARKATEET